jgi:LacI family transcriptional regulator
VVGFDNTMDSAFIDPPLTTVDQSIEKMGMLAAELVLKLIQGHPCESQQYKVATRLVIRQSCRAIDPVV